MYILTRKIRELIILKKLSQNKLAKMINYSHGAFGSMVRGEDALPDHIIKKIAPILEVSEVQIRSWILADKYSKEVLESAALIKKKIKLKKNQLIITIKIDEILQEKGMSRTALSKEIKYSQSGLNRIIVGKESLSKSVKERIAPILEVSEDAITSWVVADKYDIEVIEFAIKELDVNNL